MLRLVTMLQDEGIKIDGVGMQAHFTAGEAPSLDQQIDVIQSYEALGVEVALTELDVRLDKLPPTDELLALQKEDYKNVSLQSPPQMGLYCAKTANSTSSLSAHVLRSLLASASRFGISTTRSAGYRTPSRARAQRFFGLRISPTTPLTPASLLRLRTPPGYAASKVDCPRQTMSSRRPDPKEHVLPFTLEPVTELHIKLGHQMLFRIIEWLIFTINQATQRSIAITIALPNSSDAQWFPIYQSI